MQDTPIAAAARLLSRALRVVCLTGAGVSAESGIATFREAQTGLWARFDPMDLASPEGFAANPGLVWRWYMDRLAAVEAAAPNAGHRALARLAVYVPELVLVTQNVDDLHERAGSRPVIHLHGEIGRFRCERCRTAHDLSADDRQAATPPACFVCGARIRPGVVWFGEMLPGDAIFAAQEAAAQCDVMIVAGTSGVVHPAAELPWLALRAGAALIDVNPSPTPYSDRATVYLQGPSGVLLPQVLAALAP